MILEAIKKRRSFRTYKRETVSNEALSEIIKAAQFAPTSMGNASVEFILVKDQVIKDAIFKVVDQEYIKEAPVLIVPVISKEKSGLPIQDLSLASAFIFLQAAELGLGTVWKHMMPDWAPKVKEILNLPAEYELTNIIPVGYAKEEKPVHSDEEFSEEKIHFEKWGN
jgi:nitroreductase